MSIPWDSATQGVDFKDLADLAVNTLAERGVRAHPVQLNYGFVQDSIQVVVFARWNPDELEVYARERLGSGQPTRALAAVVPFHEIGEGGVKDAVQRAAQVLAERYRDGWPQQAENVVSERVVVHL